MNVLAALLMILEITATTEPPQKYHEAYNKAMKNGSPMLIVIGAEWCPACRRLKDDTLPEVARSGGWEGIELAYVDVDRDAIAKKLQQGTRIPQIVRYERSAVGEWSSQRWLGPQDGASLHNFAKGADQFGKTLLTSGRRKQVEISTH